MVLVVMDAMVFTNYVCCPTPLVTNQVLYIAHANVDHELTFAFFLVKKTTYLNLTRSIFAIIFVTDILIVVNLI